MRSVKRLFLRNGTTNLAESYLDRIRGTSSSRSAPSAANSLPENLLFLYPNTPDLQIVLGKDRSSSGRRYVAIVRPAYDWEIQFREENVVHVETRSDTRAYMVVMKTHEEERHADVIKVLRNMCDRIGEMVNLVIK